MNRSHALTMVLTAVLAALAGGWAMNCASGSDTPDEAPQPLPTVIEAVTPIDGGPYAVILDDPKHFDGRKVEVGFFTRNAECVYGIGFDLKTGEAVAEALTHLSGGQPWRLGDPQGDRRFCGGNSPVSPPEASNLVPLPSPEFLAEHYCSSCDAFAYNPVAYEHCKHHCKKD